MGWFHMGKAIAKQHSVLSVISVPTLFHVIKEYASLLPACTAYARLFIKALHELGEIVSDLPIDFDCLQDLASKAFAGPPHQKEQPLASQHGLLAVKKGVRVRLARTLSLVSSGPSAR